jgi:hypothetical protein
LTAFGSSPSNLAFAALATVGAEGAHQISHELASRRFGENTKEMK